ncbi:hypothetical protein JB92DRAFT_3132910 [Gautieria morchelliformis]|nr:hypothetical protein JB92DRAFT_3132910 [Gautieria morchelliformis]
MPVNSFGFVSSPTPIDHEMLDTNANEERPSLPTSLSDFALFPTSSSTPPCPSSAVALDDGLFRRLRRSSLLAANPITAALGEGKTGSPLAISFTPRQIPSLDSKMADDSSPETPSETQSVLFTNCNASSSSSGTTETPSTSRPAGPASSSLSADSLEPPARLNTGRVAHPPKPARLLDLRELTSPIESELKSEAQFQRLIASYSYNGFPPGKHVPRAQRAWSDRGRYPEEVGGDDDDLDQAYESASEDGEGAHGAGSVHSVNVTPSGSGEDQAMTIDTSLAGGFMMDVDMASPLLPPSAHSAISSPTQPQWRQTPPPTSSAVRSNKRKFDDRYDPYPTAAKRRAVSPSVNTLHPHAHHSHSHPHQSHSHSHSHQHSHSHSHSHHSSRSGSSSHSHPSASPISIPIPRSARSVTSSPVLRPTSSPVMRPTSFPGQSPILKGTSSPTMRSIARLPPLASLRGGYDGERDKSRKCVDGAEEAVSSLSLA